MSQPDDSAPERAPAPAPDMTATDQTEGDATAEGATAADASVPEAVAPDAADASVPEAVATDASTPEAVAADPSAPAAAPAPAPDRAPPPTIPPQPTRPAYPMALEPPDPNLEAGQAPIPGAAAPGIGTTAAMPAQHTAAAGYPAEQGSPPGGRGRTGLVFTSVAAAVALVAAGVLGYLWWDTDRELTETRDELTAQVEELTQTAADQEEEISGLERDLQRTEDALGVAERDLEGARNMVEVLQDEQGVIRQCVALNAEVLDAIFTGNEAAFNSVIDEAEEVCDEADQILGS